MTTGREGIVPHEATSCWYWVSHACNDPGRASRAVEVDCPLLLALT
jgi:hypothetical protein